METPILRCKISHFILLISDSIKLGIIKAFKVEIFIVLNVVVGVGFRWAELSQNFHKHNTLASPET